jgi:RNA chaperone Hfq
MSIHAVLPGMSRANSGATDRMQTGASKRWSAPSPFQLTSHAVEEDTSQRQAELFYLQKQIQSQTPMVVVLEDGEQVEGCIEWYDRYSLKVRGRAKTLIYKAAVKYMYKVGDAGR